MTCPYCREAVPDGARYCPACGRDVSPGETPTVLVEDMTRLGIPAGTPPPSRPGSRPGSNPSSPSLSRTSVDFGRFYSGQVLGGRYRIARRLGRGGMGEVYLADDLTLEQPVALKFLPADVERDPARLAQLRQEVRMARQVSHPNICRVHDLADVDGVHCITMEYVDGEDLASLLKRIGRLPEEKAIALARQLAAGLAAAHARGVLHRDLKPANVMVDGDGHVRVTDFGLAVAGAAGEGTHAGTPAYMAPEQLDGRPATERSDIFALGLVLYELFTGKRAFAAKTIDDLRHSHQYRALAPPADVVSSLNPQVNALILKCLDPDPAHRPASAFAVAAALPGGDPLAAAIAAGETPSPELVAASGGDAATLTPIAGAALVLFTIGALVVALMLADRFRLVARVPMPLSAAALDDRARTFERSVGAGTEAVDHASGFTIAAPPLGWILARETEAERDARFQQARPAAVTFWHRSSPKDLAPMDARTKRPAPGDPPLLDPGMTLTFFDTTGRLIEFAAVPRRDAAESRTGVEDAEAQRVLWKKFFAAAGLDVSAFSPTPSLRAPRFFADQRLGWSGSATDLPGVPLRIEAASFNGTPTSFAIVGPWSPGAAPPAVAATTSTADLVSVIASAIIVPLCLTGGVLLARRNLQHGRGDRRGAVALGLFVFALTIAEWLIGATHFLNLRSEQARVGAALSGALFSAAVYGLLYLAIEPQIRRVRPQMLVTWSRVMSGRLRDATLGRDLVVGAATGVFCTLVTFAHYLLPDWFGWPAFPPAATHIVSLAGAGGAAGAVLARVSDALLMSLIGGAGLMLLRIVIPDLRVCAAIATVIFAFLAAEGQIVTGRLWLDLSIGVLLVLPMLLVIMRYGFVAGAVAFGIHFFTKDLPTTLDTGRPYFTIGLAVVVLTLACAIVGFVLARGRAPLFGRLLDEA